MKTRKSGFPFDMSLRNLRKLADHALRETEIAESFTGEKDMIAQTLRVDRDPETGDWRHVITLYCGADRCPDCPHGPYVFVCRLGDDGTTEWDYDPMAEPMAESAG